jgi:hypothetical protein
MIKRFTFVRRAMGITPDGFHEAWRSRHADLLAAHPALRGQLLRWELLHRLDEDYARSREATELEGLQWDAVSVQEFPDEAALHTFDAALSAGWDAGLLAESHASVITAAPTVIVERAGGKARAGLRLTAILRHNAALELPVFHAHWREHHGDLYRSVPALNEPVFHYDQNHGIDLPGAEFDGVTEQWFGSLAAWIDSICVPEQSGLIDPDVAYFLEPASISYLLSGQPTVLVA